MIPERILSDTDRKNRASCGRLERATTKVSFIVSFPRIDSKPSLFCLVPREHALSHHFGEEEKGVDVRFALDVIRLANQQAYDVGVIFNQDLTEVADEIRSIARMQARWIKLASAFPRRAHPP